MVLPGADRESDSSTSGNNTDQSGASRVYPDRRLINPRANNYQPNQNNPPDHQQPLTPEQRRLQQLASPDLSHLDFDALLSKQRSLWKYVNPAYPRLFGLQLGLKLATTQITINRELSREEITQYADALTLSNAAGTTYKRIILWPAIVAIIAYSRGRKQVPLRQGTVADLLSWKRPANQFLVAYSLASVAEGRGYQGKYTKQMQENTRLQSLHRELTESLYNKFGAPADEIRRRQVEETRIVNQQAAENMMGSRRSPRDDAAPVTDAFQDDDSSPTGGAFAKDNWNSASQYESSSKPSGADDYLSPSNEPDPYNDDASPAAPSSRKQEVSGSAWDRLRKRAENGSDDRRSQGSASGAYRSSGQTSSDYSQDSGQGVWDSVRNSANSGRSKGVQSSIGSDGTETTERGYSDRSDAWDRRRNVGSEQASLGDSFSFPNSDEERELAKAEAQAEFDKRVERERQGKDFSSEGGGKRW